MQEKSKRIRIMAGPNGSGKSTILKSVRNSFYSGPFVNADDIEKSFQDKKLVNIAAEYGITIQDSDFTSYFIQQGQSWITKAKQENSNIGIICKNGVLVTDSNPSPHDAALAADFIRYELLKKGETFTFETVLSHPSKIEFLKESNKLGFKNYLYFICTVSPDINIDRVIQRVKLGGHDVPVDKIRNRYHESLKCLPKIIAQCYRCYFFDNSSETQSIEPIAIIDANKTFKMIANQVPWWLQKYVIDSLY